MFVRKSKQTSSEIASRQGGTHMTGRWKFIATLLLTLPALAVAGGRAKNRHAVGQLRSPERPRAPTGSASCVDQRTGRGQTIHRRTSAELSAHEERRPLPARARVQDGARV